MRAWVVQSKHAQGLGLAQDQPIPVCLVCNTAAYMSCCRDFKGIYQECADVLYEEIDYLNEGRNAGRRPQLTYLPLCNNSCLLVTYSAPPHNCRQVQEELCCHTLGERGAACWCFTVCASHLAFAATECCNAFALMHFIWIASQLSVACGPQVVVPRIFWEYCSPRVLTLE